MFFVLLTQYFPWDHPLTSDARHSSFVSKDIRSSRLWSLSLFQVCCSSSTAHLSCSDFLHERVFVSQEKRNTSFDLRAKHAVVPGQRTHVARGLDHTQPNAVTTRRAVSEPPVLHLVVEWRRASHRSRHKSREGLSEGLWAVESGDDGQDCESHQQEASQRASTASWLVGCQPC